MFKKRFWAIAAVFTILLLMPAFAQSETLTGILDESPAYIGYQACVDSCESCAENCRFNAYRMAAEIESNEELCNQLPESMKEMCTNRVYSAKAAAAKDTLLCEKIASEEEKGMCMLGVQIEKALSRQDETECSLAPEGLENACLYAYHIRQEANNMPGAKQDDGISKCGAKNKEGEYRKSSKRTVTKVIIALAFTGIIFYIVARKRIKNKPKHARKKRV